MSSLNLGRDKNHSNDSNIQCNLNQPETNLTPRPNKRKVRHSKHPTDHFDSQTDLVVCLEHVDDAGEGNLSINGGGEWGVEDQVVSAVLLGGDDEVGPTVCHLRTSTVGGSHRGQG